MLFVFFLQHTECALKKKKLKLGQNSKVGGSCFWAPMYCMLTMCFLNNCKVLVLLWMFQNSKKRQFFAKLSYAGKNFYCFLNMWAIIFSAYLVCGVEKWFWLGAITFSAHSVCGQEFLPATQSSQKNKMANISLTFYTNWIFCFSPPQVTYLDGITHYK